MTESPNEPSKSRESGQAYWRRNLRITGSLLAVWFVVTFVAAYFARDLNFKFFGWPFSFWMAAQGSLLVYLAIVCWYAFRIDRLDREFGMAEDD